MTANITNNPCGLDGFAFLEFSGPDKLFLDQVFRNMGFEKIATHQQQDINLYQQGQIKFIVNAARDCQAEQHAQIHGAGACAMGFRVKDAEQALDYATTHGATPFQDSAHASHGLPAIQAIGGSVIYFVDEKHQPFANDWQINSNKQSSHYGLNLIDHLTHNVQRGNMDTWAHFYEKIFNFHQIRYFNIEGQMTGLISRAMASPCGKIKIPLNESKDEQSQIAEFLSDYHGEGIQHVALSTETIYKTVHTLRAQGINFLDVPDTYYDMINARLPWHQEPLATLQAERILIDGEKEAKGGLLLQIFTKKLVWSGIL